MLFNIAATISGEVVLREYSSDPGAPIATSARRKAMDDATVVRADAWSSVTLQRRTMEPALSGDTPPPARMMILPAAFSTSRESISAPSRAEGAWPEVRMRVHPRDIIVSRASNGSRQRSNARWKVTSIEPAAATSLRQASTSTSPCGVSAPITTPFHPYDAHSRTSCSITSTSSAV